VSEAKKTYMLLSFAKDIGDMEFCRLKNMQLEIIEYAFPFTWGIT